MNNLLAIRDLCVDFATDEGTITAVDRLDLDIPQGEALGLVGESGAGKTVAAMSLLRLIPSPPGHIRTGQVLLGQTDLLALPLPELRRVRGHRIGIIFQEPMTALSPLHRVGRQLIEAYRFHHNVTPRTARGVALDWLAKVGLPDPAARFEAYPHELSGGMRQRVMIAMTLMLDPALIIADEPTTALDVTIQAQILELIKRMRRPDTALLLITHDMAIIREMCDRVAVMYAAQLVESARSQDLFGNPLHPYTRALLAAIPSLSGRVDRLPTIPGQVPSPHHLPPGCRFAARCPQRMPCCDQTPPALHQAGPRAVACHLYPPGAAIPPAARHDLST